MYVLIFCLIFKEKRRRRKKRKGCYTITNRLGEMCANNLENRACHSTKLQATSLTWESICHLL